MCCVQKETFFCFQLLPPPIKIIAMSLHFSSRVLCFPKKISRYFISLFVYPPPRPVIPFNPFPCNRIRACSRGFEPLSFCLPPLFSTVYDGMAPFFPLVFDFGPYYDPPVWPSSAPALLLLCTAPRLSPTMPSTTHKMPRLMLCEIRSRGYLSFPLFCLPTTTLVPPALLPQVFSLLSTNSLVPSAQEVSGFRQVPQLFFAPPLSDFFFWFCNSQDFFVFLTSPDLFPVSFASAQSFLTERVVFPTRFGATRLCFLLSRSLPWKPCTLLLSFTCPSFFCPRFHVVITLLPYCKVFPPFPHWCLTVSDFLVSFSLIVVIVPLFFLHFYLVYAPKQPV